MLLLQCWVEDGSKNEDDPYPLSDEEDEEETIDDTTLTWGRESHHLSYFHYSNPLNDDKDSSSVIPSNEDHINEIADHAFDYVSDSDSEESYESYESFNSTSNDSTESSSDDSTSDDSSSTSYSSLSDSSVDNRYSDLFESQSVSQTDSKTNESVSTEPKKSVSSNTPKIRKLYIQMEYYKNGTLDDMIQRGDVSIIDLDNEQLYKNKALIWRILSNVHILVSDNEQLLNGLQYVHKYSHYY